MNICKCGFSFPYRRYIPLHGFMIWSVLLGATLFGYYPPTEIDLTTICYCECGRSHMELARLEGK